MFLMCYFGPLAICWDSWNHLKKKNNAHSCVYSCNSSCIRINKIRSGKVYAQESGFGVYFVLQMYRLS